MDDIWKGVLEQAIAPPTPSPNRHPSLDRLQTAAETARLVSVELHGPVDGREPRAFRVIFQLMDDFRGSGDDVRQRLVGEEPDLTHDARFDAFLAAVVEDMSLNASPPVPAWAARRDDLLPGF